MYYYLLLVLIFIFTFCSSQDNAVEPNPEFSQKITAVGYTSHQADGNRIVYGTGTLPNARVFEIPLNDIPEWVVAAPLDEGSVWVVVLTDGEIQVFKIIEYEITPITIVPDKLPPGTPPLLIIYEDGKIGLANVLKPEASLITNPAVLSNEKKRIAYIENNGDLVIQDEDNKFKLNVNALPDARILVDDLKRMIVLTDPTDRYGHGVLGDEIEAGSITLIESTPTPSIKLKIEMTEPAVIEGISPIWADLTGDGIREIVVTVSDAKQGARLVVFNENGKQIVTSEAIGRGFRWRHQIVIAPFGDDDEPDIISVRTPHIGGIVEFLHLAEDKLSIVAQIAGCTSHIIGTRNLDMAIAGDFDGDGKLELLLPNQILTNLCAIQRTGKTAFVDWSVAIGGEITTNIAAVTLNNCGIALGIGTNNQTLKLWLP